MDQLPALGKSIFQIVGPTLKIYGSILQKHAVTIKSTPGKTFTYGSDPRQTLDVYYPSKNPTGAGCPILIFVYGGGLVSGSKIVPVVEGGLVYANLAHFFAEKCGYIVVIPDYRLVPNARFPSGGEDIALTINWIRSNLWELGGVEAPRDLFIMGNSAGGVHLSTYLFSPVFSELRKQVLDHEGNSPLTLKAAILLSVPMHFQAANASRKQVLESYYGDRLTEDCPLGLLKALTKRTTVQEALPGVKFLVLTGTLDPDDEILNPNKEFIDVWSASASQSYSNLQVEVMEGQNHISPPLSLATDDAREEAWGFQVAEFCNSAREG